MNSHGTGWPVASRFLPKPIDSFRLSFPAAAGGRTATMHRRDNDEEPSIPPTSAPGGARQGLLEEVLGEYMQRLDRGEAVDREQLLAHHPELAAELQSYFAGSDEMAQFGRHLGTEGQTEPLFRADSKEHPTNDRDGWFGDYELLEQIGEGGMGVIYKARQRDLRRLVALKM